MKPAARHILAGFAAGIAATVIVIGPQEIYAQTQTGQPSQSVRYYRDGSATVTMFTRAHTAKRGWVHEFTKVRKLRDGLIRVDMTWCDLNRGCEPVTIGG